MTMQVMDQVARRNGLACMFHEKPFEDVNGSGKHNNWSIGTNQTGTLLAPGKTPDTNLEFLLAVAGVVRATDIHSDLLRWCISGASNDNRLGGHEAPPAIISIFAGAHLSAIISSIANGEKFVRPDAPMINLGISHLPQIFPDNSDRNRTSPFAFTGNKFEVRACGSSQNPYASNTVLNAIMHDSFTFMENEVRSKVANGQTPRDAAMTVIRDIFKKHRRIIFDGNGYSSEWVTEAAKRGLPNYAATPDVLDAVSTSQVS